MSRGGMKAGAANSGGDVDMEIQSNNDLIGEYA